MERKRRAAVSDRIIRTRDPDVSAPKSWEKERRIGEKEGKKQIRERIRIQGGEQRRRESLQIRWRCEEPWRRIVKKALRENKSAVGTSALRAAG